MYTCWCVYVFVCVCARVHISICMYIDISYTFTYDYIHRKQLSVRVFVKLAFFKRQKSILVRECVLMYIYVSIRTYIYAHLHTNTHTQTHTCVCAYMYACMSTHGQVYMNKSDGISSIKPTQTWKWMFAFWFYRCVVTFAGSRICVRVHSHEKWCASVTSTWFVGIARARGRALVE